MADPAEVAASRPAPQTRRSRDELRELLISAGVELLVEEGLGTGAGHLTFKRVFEWLEQTTGVRVTNASVIGRIWTNQSEYQTEVLVAIASSDGSEVLESAFRALQPSLARFDRRTIEGRWGSLREMARVGGSAHIALLSGSKRWQRWVGVWALVMAGTGPDTTAGGPVADALREGYEVVTRRFELAYSRMLSSFGFRLRQPFTLRQLTLSTGALAEGCVLRFGVDEASTKDIVRPTGPNGEDQDWTLFSVGIEALLRAFVEIDPDWDPDGPASQRRGEAGPSVWAALPARRP
jgi:hypothetical protein